MVNYDIVFGMSFELPVSNNNLENIPLDIDSLNEKLKHYFYNFDGSSLKDEKANYLENVTKNKELQDLVEDYPDYFDLMFYYLGEKIYSNEEKKRLAKNIRARQEEVIKNKKEVQERIKTDPVATEEEYRLGIYVESLETQVRGAVLELQKKGYKPNGSGFFNLTRGTQSIILDDENQDLERIKKNLPENVTIFREGGDIHIILEPKMDESMIDIKNAWDGIASSIPPSDKISNIFSHNGDQGVEFRDAQNKIKQGKNIWLGNNIAFVGNRIVEITYEDFTNMENKNQ